MLALALTVAASGLASLAPNASAAATSITGTLNCGGYMVYYNTTRATSADYIRVDLSVSTFAGSKYGDWSDLIGAKIVRTGTYMGVQVF